MGKVYNRERLTIRVHEVKGVLQQALVFSLVEVDTELGQLVELRRLA